MVDLYNLDSVLNSLAPALVGEPPGGGAWQKQNRRFPAGEPVVEIVGDRASGKTTLVNALHDGYHALVPTARVDVGGAPYSAALPADRDRLEAVNASPVTHLLFQLSYELHKTHRNRVIEFPRLAPALLLLATWRPERLPGNGNPQGAPYGPLVWPAQLTDTEEALRRRLAGRPAPAADPSGTSPLDAWLSALTAVVGGLITGLPGLKEILDAGVVSLRHRRAAEKQWQWWVGRLHHFDGDGVQRLFSLVQDFQAGGALRHAVEQHLIAAFLTDVDAAYGRWAALNTHPPLILLDNVDERLRARFLDPYVHEYGSYRDAVRVPGRKPHGRTVLPVTLVTSLGYGAGHPAGHPAAPGARPGGPAPHPATDPEPWTRPELCPPRSWLLRLGVPRVTEAEIRSMLVGVPQPPALAVAVERLSGGRTGCALLLTEAAARRLRSREPFDLSALLTLPAPGRASIQLGERLLELLLPDDPVLRARLRTLAPALDGAEAARLVPLFQLGVNPELTVSHLRDTTLGLPHWNARPWPGGGEHGTPLVTDRALRAVLLSELRARDPEAHWHEIHRRLTVHHNPGAVLAEDSPEHPPPYLHHALASGRLDSTVVRAMHRRYEDESSTPAQWLRELNLVAAAPAPFGGYPARDAAPGPQPACHTCEQHEAGPGAGRLVHTAIRDLLVTVWRLSGPLSAPPTGHGHEDIGTVGRALQTLCTDYGNRTARSGADGARNAYVDALARDGWPDALIDGVQAPDLPSREGGGR